MKPRANLRASVVHYTAIQSTLSHNEEALQRLNCIISTLDSLRTIGNIDLHDRYVFCTQSRTLSEMWNQSYSIFGLNGQTSAQSYHATPKSYTDSQDYQS